MRIEELIGRNVKEAREDAGLTQRELGEEVGKILGRAWLPQAVSQAEKGARDWAARDLVAVATALRRPVAWFLKAPEDVDPQEDLELSEEAPSLKIPIALASGERMWARTMGEIIDELSRLTKELQRMGAATGFEPPRKKKEQP